MKTLFLSFLTLLAFTACSDGYEQLMDDSAQTRALSNEANSEKFEFGKMYAIDEIPADVYNYIPKDTIYKYINPIKFKGDSIRITPINNELQTSNNQKPQSYSSQHAIGKFSLKLDTYQKPDAFF